MLVPVSAVEAIVEIPKFERRPMKKSDQERGELRARDSRRILDRLGFIEYLEAPLAKSELLAS